MAQNEAKVKFNADATEFTKAISAASRQIAELQSELRLNAAQMSTMGQNVDTLTQRQKILTQQAQTLADKKAALVEKLRLAEQYFKADSSQAGWLRIQLNNLETQSAKLESEIAQTAQALAQQEAAAAKTETATEQLSNQISQQENELADLKRQYSDAVLTYGKTSDEAQGLASQIKALSKELDDNRQTMKDAKTLAEEEGDAVDALSKIIADQESELGELKRAYANASLEYGKNSDQAQGLASQIKALSKELDDNRQTMRDAKTLAEEEGDAVDALSKIIADQESKLGELKRAYANASLEFGKNSNQAKELSSEISDLSGKLGASRKALENATQSADELDHSLKKNKESSKEASDGFTTMKGALADLVADGIQKTTDEFWELMTASSAASANFQAQTGASKAEMDSFTDSIESLYAKNFGESMQDIADAMAEVKKQTNEIDPSKLEQMTANAITLQDTFGYDYAETIRAANMLMQQFGLTSDQAFSFIVKGAQEGLDKNGDLLDTINEYSSYYKAQGYSADEFYNSLKNGTAAGTFSVDKLGDAMKEFGIRVKDTSTTTSDGFAILGYSAAASAEDVAKTKDEIATLEKNLKYATMEQESFNSKTSELTRLKNADKIQEYSQSLEEARAKLAQMTSETGTTGKSLEDLQARFAEGGEAARAATSEVLEALYTLDDPVQQNAAGVALFGSMWEDLGADGVKALMDVSGEAVTTTDAMKELTSVKYSDIGSSIAEVGRALEGELLQPLVNQVTPAIMDFSSSAVEGIAQFSDAIKSASVWCNQHQTIISLLGIGIGGLTIAIGAYKAAQALANAGALAAGLIQAGETAAITAHTVALGVQTAATTAATIATTAFGAVMAFVTSPITLVVLAITALIAIGVALYQNWDKISAFAQKLWDNLAQIFEGICQSVSEKIQAVAETLSSIGKGIAATASSVWNGMKTTVVNAASNIYSSVSQRWNSIKSTTSSVFNSVRSTASSTWSGIKSAVSNAASNVYSSVSQRWNSIKSTTSGIFSSVRSTASSAWSSIKSTISSGASSALSTVTSKFNSIKSKISSIMNSAKSTVSNVISAIKSKFNFSWSLPKLKLPHVKITGKFSINPPSVPKFSISWYKEGGILQAPTIFGASGNTLLGGGEAGPEAVAPIDVLQGYVAAAVERTITSSMSGLAASIQALASRPIYLQINGRTFAMATAGDTDDALGIRQALAARGLCL